MPDAMAADADVLLKSSVHEFLCDVVTCNKADKISEIDFNRRRR